MSGVEEYSLLWKETQRELSWGGNVLHFTEVVVTYHTVCTHVHIHQNTYFCGFLDVNCTSIKQMSNFKKYTPSGFLEYWQFTV